MAGIGDFFSGLGNAAAGYVTGVGNVLTGNIGGTVSAAQNNPYAKPATPSTYRPTVTTPSSTGSRTSAEDAARALADSQNAALDRQTQAIYAQIAAQPKLAYRDVNAAWQTAQNSAASSVNPVYQDNLNRKLSQMALARTQRTADVSASKQAEDTTLAQTQQDIGTNRVRTAEDTASGIAKSQANEANWQTQEGQQADAKETAARLAIGDQGQEGKGAQSLETDKIIRNQGSAQATQDFTDERATKQMLATRTFQDLDTKSTRAVQFNDVQKKNLDRNLQDFVDNQALEEQDFRATNESQRLSALYQATDQKYKTDTAAWLASLAQSGMRAQDIAATASVYGRM